MKRDPKTGKILRKYNLDVSYFDKIDTEEKAYFLGFLFADGYNNTDRNSINLGLRHDDKDILVELNALVQPDKPLQYVKYKVNCTSQPTYRLVMCSSHMSKQLVKLGCTKAKSHSLVFPSEADVSEELLNHFVRGYFDGDGHVRKKDREQFSITGNKAFISSLQEVIIHKVEGFKKTKLLVRFPDRETETVSLVSCGVNKAIAFRDWLYKDATIYMKRKKAIFDSYPL